MRKILLGRLVVVGLAVLVGLFSYHLFVGWFTVIPWMVITLALGFSGTTRKHTLINGAIFGYVLFLSYIFAGYRGKPDSGSLSKFILFNLLFSLIGALAGVLGSWMGYFIRKKFFSEREG